MKTCKNKVKHVKTDENVQKMNKNVKNGQKRGKGIQTDENQILSYLITTISIKD